MQAGTAARVSAQQSERPERDAKSPEAKPAEGCDAAATKEDSSATDHTIHLGAQTIPYKATAGFTHAQERQGRLTGLMYSVAYTRSDVKDLSQRPVSFLYNGGPGSATMWLHMGAFGPRRVHVADGEFTPPAPYKLVDNTESLLDKTDLVFIDAMGTGYSHAVCKAENKDFWGIDEDIDAFGQFIDTYLSRNDRWNSPKFLIGESYGTFRSAALGNYLQNHLHDAPERHRPDFVGARSLDDYLRPWRRPLLRLLSAELRGRRVVPQGAEGSPRRFAHVP